jgi:chromosome segregation ATPase
MNLNDIKAQLQNNWKAWDTSGDGKLDAGDLVERFDSNGDGTIDEGELEMIADQLSTQLEYSNSLLQELQEAEARQLELQRELNSKNELCRSTGTQLEQLRQENTEVRRKWKVSQEIGDSMTKQSKDHRVEIRALKTDLDRSIKDASDAHALLKDTTEERARLQRALTNAQTNIGSTKADAERAFRGFEEKNASLTESSISLKRELEVLKAKVGPMEQERFSMRQNVQELSHSLEEMTSRFDSESRLRLTAEKKLREGSVAMDSTKDKFAQARIEVQDLRSKSDMATQRMRQLEADVLELEGRLQESDGTGAGLAHRLDKAETGEHQLRRECDALTQELDDTRHEMQQQKEEFIANQTEAYARQQEALEQARSTAHQGIAEASKKATAELEERRRMERQYHRSTEEVLELSKLLKSAQEEAAARAAGWTVEREGYEESIRMSKLDVAALTDECGELRNEMELEKQATASAVKELRREMLYRGERFVETLSAFQSASTSLRIEAVDLREQQKSLTADYNVMRNSATRVRELASVPRGAENEISSTLSRLFAKIAAARDKLEDSQDEIARCEIQREEEKARGIMLAESLSRVEHDLTMTTQSTSMDLAKMKLQTDELVIQLASEKEARAETESRLVKSHIALDAITTSTRNLQQQNQNITEALDDNSLRHTSNRQELDARAIELAAQLKYALQDRDKEMQARLDSVDRVSELEKLLDEKRQQMEVSRQETVETSALIEELRAKQTSAISNAGSNQQRYQQQLSQMQVMNKTLQAHKLELATENQVLKEELKAFEAAAREAADHDDEN